MFGLREINVEQHHVNHVHVQVEYTAYSLESQCLLPQSLSHCHLNICMYIAYSSIMAACAPTYSSYGCQLLCVCFLVRHCC